MTRFKKLLPFLLLIFIATTLHAQTENTLDPLTVTSASSQIQSSKTGRNITVVTAEQISKQPINSFDDLLKYLPGVEVHQRGALGSQADITIRGGTYQQVLVILDGIRLNDPLTGHFNAYIPIVIKEIDRVEILYGGSSAIYGTEAVGGVINIITKAFNALNKSQENFISSKVMVGEFGLNNTSIGGLYKLKKSVISGGINVINTDGQPQRGVSSFVNNFTGSLSFASKLSNTLNLAIRGSYDNRNFSAQNYYTNFLSDTAVEQVKTLWSHLQLSYIKGKQKFRFDVGYKTVNDSFRFNPKSTANINESSLFQAQMLYDRKLNENNFLVSGVQFVQKNITSNDRGNHNVPQVAAFAILNMQIDKNLSLNPALRFDYSDVLKTNIVAQLNASYKLKNSQLRFSIGNTIRDADFTERYNNYGKAYLKSGTLGNPYLKAETAINYELGADYFANKNLKLSFSLFQRNQSNLIDFAPTAYADMPRKDNLDPTGNYSLAKNISSITTSGLEITATYNKSWKHSSLFAMGGVLWLDNSNADAFANKSFYILAQANFIYNFNVQFAYKNFELGVNGLYKARQAMQAPNSSIKSVSENYFVANVKLSYIMPKKHFTFFVQINNFYDKTYSDLLGTVMPRRWVSGGLQFRW